MDPAFGRIEALDRLFELSNDAVFVDVDGRIAAVNDAGVALYGCERADELVGRRTEELVPEEFRSHILGRADRRLAGVEQERWANETILRADGSVCQVVARTTPVNWHRRPAVLVLLRDRSKEHAVEATLAERGEVDALVAHASYEIGTASDELLDAAITKVLADLAAFDGADRAYVILFDAEGKRILNTHEWVAEGTEAQIAYVQDLKTADFPYSYGVLLRGQAVHLPDMASPPPGAEAEAASFSLYGVRSALQVPMMAGGRLVGLVGFNHIRSRKTWREETIILLRDVGALIATAMIRRRAAEEAARARDAAMAANRAKDEFLSRMSHELRTPLNAILGFGELLAADLTTGAAVGGNPDRSGAQRQHVDRIVNAGRHLLELVEDVLDISRIESDRLPLRIEPVDAGAICSRAIDLVAEPAAAQAITVRLVATRRATVLADATRSLQVVLNVLSNAVKYNRPGGNVVVEVEPGEDVWHVVVTDDGPGIRPDRLGRVFEPFDRLGAEFTNVEGTGIGLTLARRLMTLQDGDISISSRVGEGTQVRLTFPAAVLGSPQRVFVLDDDTMVRGLVTAVLTTSGAEVLTVTDVGSLLAHPAEPGSTPPVVLVGGDGPEEVAARCAAVARLLPDATVVAMSGRPLPGDLPALPRPPDPASLRRLLAI